MKNGIPHGRRRGMSHPPANQFQRFHHPLLGLWLRLRDAAHLCPRPFFLFLGVPYRVAYNYEKGMVNKMKLILFGILLIVFATFMNSASVGMNGVWFVLALIGLILGIVGLLYNGPIGRES